MEPTSGWLTRNIRPLVVANLILVANVLVGLAVFDAESFAIVADGLTKIPTEFWGVLGSAIGLYTVGRSVEKIKGAA